MKVSIKKSKLNGNISIVPSKSYAHRLLLAACLSIGASTISNIDLSDDVKATLDFIKVIGRDFTFENNIVKFDNKDNFKFNDDKQIKIFDCNESGTTLRMIIPIALIKYNHFIIRAKERLIERGISVYEDIFKDVKFAKTKNQIEVIGDIKPGVFNVRGNISSQYISGLLYALPLLNGDSVISIATELESKNYIDMTIDTLSKFGIQISKNTSDKEKNLHFNILGNQKFKETDAIVEGDYSNAAFIDAYNFLGSNVTINNLNDNSLQGDKIYKKYFELLNNGFETLDISNCIDLGPVLFAFSSLKHGGRFVGTKRLRIKESDRVEAMKNELVKFGIKMDISENEVMIDNTNICPPKKNIDTHNDHRIAMSMAMFSSKYDIIINDAEVINKSYPNFFNDLKILGANINYE